MFLLTISSFIETAVWQSAFLRYNIQLLMFAHPRLIYFQIFDLIFEPISTFFNSFFNSLRNKISHTQKKCRYGLSCVVGLRPVRKKVSAFGTWARGDVPTMGGFLKIATGTEMTLAISNSYRKYLVNLSLTPLNPETQVLLDRTRCHYFIYTSILYKNIVKIPLTVFLLEFIIEL